MTKRRQHSVKSKDYRLEGCMTNVKASFLPGRKREVERCTLAHFRFRPDAASVPVDDPLNDGQAHPGALEIVGAMETLEDLEQFITVPHIEADTVVADVVYRRILLNAVAHFNESLFPALSEFDGIGKNVDEDLFDEGGISPGGLQFIHRQRHPPVRVESLQLFPRGRQQLAHIDLSDVQIFSAHP